MFGFSSNPQGQPRYCRVRRLLQFLLASCSLLAILGLLIVGVIRYRFILKESIKLGTGIRANGIETYMPAPDARAERSVYPFSVIPGGIASLDDVLNSVQRDPVVAQHYRDLSPIDMHFERLPVPIQVYASYRVGHSVFWTQHRIVVPRGELVLRDDSHFIRARCGNRLAFALPPEANEPSKKPPFEPPDEVFDYGMPALWNFPGEPVPVVQDVPRTNTVATPPASQPRFWPPPVPTPVWSGPIASGIPTGGSVPYYPPNYPPTGTVSPAGPTSPAPTPDYPPTGTVSPTGPTSPAPTPEPATCILLVSGGVLAAFARRVLGFWR